VTFPTVWAKQTRFLHFGLATTVSFQLLISLVMEAPEAGEKRSLLESLSFEIHEWVGMLALLVVLAHWAWSMTAKDNSNIRHLFPGGKAGRASVLADLDLLKARKLPDGGGRGGLPGLMHGLGFLAATGMALTGGVLFFILPEDGSKNDLAELIHHVHGFIANFVWAYWWGHIAAAFLHKRMGHDTVKAMFNLR
jgi:cytochrome b561